MGRFWTFIVVALVGWGAWHHFNPSVPERYVLQPHSRVIMYSLTTCGNCKRKKLELQAAGVAFEEYFVDLDGGKNRELNAKLEASGVDTRRYGMPVLDVHGHMLPNNPSMGTIRGYL